MTVSTIQMPDCTATLVRGEKEWEVSHSGHPRGQRYAPKPYSVPASRGEAMEAAILRDLAENGDADYGARSGRKAHGSDCSDYGPEYALWRLLKQLHGEPLLSQSQASEAGGTLASGHSTRMRLPM